MAKQPKKPGCCKKCGGELDLTSGGFVVCPRGCGRLFRDDGDAQAVKDRIDMRRKQDLKAYLKSLQTSLIVVRQVVNGRLRDVFQVKGRAGQLIRGTRGKEGIPTRLGRIIESEGDGPPRVIVSRKVVRLIPITEAMFIGESS